MNSLIETEQQLPHLFLNYFLTKQFFLTEPAGKYWCGSKSWGKTPFTLCHFMALGRIGLLKQLSYASKKHSKLIWLLNPFLLTTFSSPFSVGVIPYERSLHSHTSCFSSAEVTLGMHWSDELSRADSSIKSASVAELFFSTEDWWKQRGNWDIVFSQVVVTLLTQ